MEFYLDLLSQPCRSVYLFAKACKIPFEFKYVDLALGQQHTEEFGKLTAVKKVPVIKDGSFVLTESIAILEYLAKKASTPDHWYPADLQQRARVTEFLAWHHVNVRLNCAKVFLLKMFYPIIVGSEAPKEKMDDALADANQSLNLFEEKFLQDRPFIVGNKISVADLVAIVEIYQPIGAGVNVLEGRPKLQAWRDRVRKEIGEKLFDEAHETLMKPPSALQAKLKENKLLEVMKPRFLKMFP